MNELHQSQSYAEGASKPTCAFRLGQSLDKNHVAADCIVADRERRGIFGGSILGLGAVEIEKRFIDASAI
jgi:hypothetical protein